MNHLLRALAPITETGWDLLDDEARERLAPALAARKLVDFNGPHGWTHSATNVGRVSALTDSPVEGISAVRREVLPLAELRAEFTLSRAELADAERGADDTDLEPLDRAARQLAVAENQAVFHGWPGAIDGIADASPHEARSLGTVPAAHAQAIAGAVETLLENGIGGPYGIALGPAEYRSITGTSERGGYPLFNHVKAILEGPIIWTPGLTGAVVLSTRGGDFVIDSGQDISLGYLSHDADQVRLYLEESFSFHVATPEAAVVLTSTEGHGEGSED